LAAQHVLRGTHCVAASRNDAPGSIGEFIFKGVMSVCAECRHFDLLPRISST
jgi:hypothetical protein